MGLLKNENFAYSTLAGTVLIGATSLTVATGEGTLFPSTGNFMLVIYGAAYPSPGLDSTRELVKATLTSGDTFAITRAQEGTTAKEWAASDNVALVLTAGKMDELEKAVQNSSLAFGIATGTNTYAVTLDPALTAYVTGIVVNVKFTNASTGASTLNVNALGTKKIYKFESGSYSAIGSGDISASMFSTLFYDSTLDSAAGGWILVSHYIEYPTDFVTGDTLVYIGSTAPTGWTKKSDWPADSSVVVGNNYSSGGGTDSPISWTTAIDVANHSAHTHTGPSHTHTYSTVISHSHALSATNSGSVSTCDSSRRLYFGNNAWYNGGETHVSSSTAVKETGSASGTTASDGTGNTGNPSATLTHSVTQDTYTPRYVTAIAIIKD